MDGSKLVDHWQPNVKSAELVLQDLVLQFGAVAPARNVIVALVVSDERAESVRVRSGEQSE